MSKTLRVPDTVYDTIDDVQDEYEYATAGEATRHILREAGYDV